LRRPVLLLLGAAAILWGAAWVAQPSHEDTRPHGTHATEAAAPDEAAQGSGVTVQVDAASPRQVMAGFGSSVRVFDDPHVFDNFDPATQRAATTLTHTQEDEVMDLLYRDLGLTRVRPITEGASSP